MIVIVDTPVWSELLRRRSPNLEVKVRMAEILEKEAVIGLGPIKQELLSGIRDELTFQKLVRVLAEFAQESIQDADYVVAARYSNTCQAQGVQGSNTDFLICAVSWRIGASIWTFDKDFSLYKEHLPIQLFE